MKAKYNQSKTLRLAGSCIIILTLLCLILLGNDVFAEKASKEDALQDAATSAAAANIDKSEYMSLEEAGDILRQYLVARRTDKLILKFCFESDLGQMTDYMVGDVLLAEAYKHTGVPTEGDTLFWCMASYSYDTLDDVYDGKYHYVEFSFGGTDNGVEGINPDYYQSATREQVLNQKVKEIMASLNLDGKSDYEKVCAVYDYVCQNVVYSEKYLAGELVEGTQEYNDIWTAYGALVNGEATCEGFSTAMYRLLLEAGVDNRLEFSTGVSTEGDIGHGWNLVKLGELYYYLDATWDCGKEPSEYDWFLRGEGNFFGTETSSANSGHIPSAGQSKQEFREKYPVAHLDYGAPATVTASGTCGDLTWTLTEDGTLTISGNGPIPNDDEYFQHYWNKVNEYIKRVVIEDGVTAIGNHAFWNCPQLVSVSIPSSVKTIGTGAFGLCRSLFSITIPDSVTSIGSKAFIYDASLVSVKLSNRITSISSHMFWQCVSLQTVNIPSGVTSIGEVAFYCCISLKSVVLPDMLKTLENGAFANAFDPREKVEIVIPESVTFVGETCFAWSTIHSVVWEAKTEKLETWMFYLNYYLETVELSDSIKSFGYDIFQECVNLRYVKLPVSLETVDEWTFLNCYSLEEIELPATLKNISPAMFSGCISLKSISIPNSVTVVGRGAFDDCILLKSIVLPDKIEVLGSCAFRGTSIREISIPSGIKEVGENAFQGVSRIVFEGDAPEILDGMCASGGPCYYPVNNDTWTEEKIAAAGGTMRGYHRSDDEPHKLNRLLTDDTKHWYECGCGYVSDAEIHYSADGNLNCDICGLCSHDWYTEFNEDKHWHICEACRYCADDYEEHQYSGAEDTDCDVCGYERTPEVVKHHKTWQYDLDGHWYTCSCGEVGEREDHVYQNNCDRTCEKCKFERGINHKYEYKNDKTHHWYECSVCGELYEDGKKLHKYRTACEAKCWDCGYERTVQHTLTPMSSFANHWKACSCGYTTDTEAHVYDDNCDGECNVCEFTRKAPHNYVWSYDKNLHWSMCECGNTDCPPIDHTFKDGVCIDCGAEQAVDPEKETPSGNEKDPVPEKDNTVLIVAIAAGGAVAVIGIAVLAILLSKKKKQ